MPTARLSQATDENDNVIPGVYVSASYDLCPALAVVDPETDEIIPGFETEWTLDTTADPKTLTIRTSFGDVVYGPPLVWNPRCGSVWSKVSGPDCASSCVCVGPLCANVRWDGCDDGCESFAPLVTCGLPWDELNGLLIDMTPGSSGANGEICVRLSRDTPEDLNSSHAAIWDLIFPNGFRPQEDNDITVCVQLSFDCVGSRSHWRASITYTVHNYIFPGGGDYFIVARYGVTNVEKFAGDCDSGIEFGTPQMLHINQHTPNYTCGQPDPDPPATCSIELEFCVR